MKLNLGHLIVLAVIIFIGWWLYKRFAGGA